MKNQNFYNILQCHKTYLYSNIYYNKLFAKRELQTFHQTLLNFHIVNFRILNFRILNYYHIISKSKKIVHFDFHNSIDSNIIIDLFMRFLL